MELIINSFHGNIALFFKSHNELEQALGILNLKKPVYREYLGMKQELLMKVIDSFKSDSDAVLAGVMGGRLAEGVDYPDESLEMAIIAGIPYPPPRPRQKALKHYYDGEFDGRGWQFAVIAPTVRKMLQAAGRVVRSETDRGFIVIIDERARRFLDYMPELQASDDIVSEIREFFEA